MSKENTSIRLKKIMTDRRLRQADILNLCQPYSELYNVRIGRNDLSQYVNGKVEPGQHKLTVLAKALGVSETWLMGYDNNDTDNTISCPFYPTIKVPILGTVAAGTPITAQQDVIGMEEIPADWAKHGEYFGLKIKGDSMEPKIHDGSTVIVRVQSNAENNDIVIAMVNDEATCKRLHKYADSIVLNSINTDYEPIILTNDKEVRILGKVVRLIEDF